jgi:GAF domain-containing protein
MSLTDRLDVRQARWETGLARLLMLADRAAGAETFLWVRLTRLAAAADEAVTAARTGDANGLRRHLHRCDDLARAMWAVQRALCGQVPGPRPSGRPSPHPSSSPEQGSP